MIVVVDGCRGLWDAIKILSEKVVVGVSTISFLFSCVLSLSFHWIDSEAYQRPQVHISLTRLHLCADILYGGFHLVCT